MPGPKPLKGPNFKGPSGPTGPKGPNFKGPNGPNGPSGPSGPRPPRAPNPPRGGSMNTPKPAQQGGVIRDATRFAQEFIKKMPGTQPARPNPYTAKPTGRLTGPSGTSARGGILTGLAGAVSAVAVPAIVKESVAGARVIAGDPYAHLPPSIKSINGTNYDISTESGRKGYDQAKNSQVSNKPAKKFNNTAEINARLDQEKKDRAAALAITKGDYDHSSGDFGLVPDSTNDASKSGRDDTRIAPTGLPQTGTSMSKSFNQILETTNTSGYQPFGGKQLPTTTGHPDSKIGPVTNGVVYSDMLQNAPGFGTVGVGPLANGEAYARAVEGRAKSPSRLDTALSDTAGISSYMNKFSSGDRERAANRAFLDIEDSMDALRAKEAVNGVVFAQNRHYISGKSGDDQAIGIDRDQARDISSGKSSAQSLLEAHIAKNIDVSEDTPASAQNPLSEAGEAIKSAFAAGAQTDFALNNNQVGPRTGVGPVVDPNIIENYDFTKPGAEEAYFKKLNSGGFFR